MNTRFFSSTLTAAALAVLLAAPMFAQAPSSSKPPAAAVKSSIPRTADGQPDLSGVYSNVTTVPMTRPANCGDKEFYTAEDIANGLGGNRGCGGNAAGRGGGHRSRDRSSGARGSL